jgi:two-component system cell cycle sensor histidine kinase/response regulator CckA
VGNSESAPDGGKETILLVEDDPLVRRLATRVLERHGYTVLQAEDGFLALELERAHTGEIMLLLSDVVMPRMNGQALAERLLRSRPALKVLYVSGYTDNPVVHQGVLDRSVAFLAKPYTPTALARKVRDVLDSD